MNQQITEGLFECQYGSYQVRVWRAITPLDDPLDRKYFSDIRDRVKIARDENWVLCDLAVFIAAMPKVNAVQVKLEEHTDMSKQHLEARSLVIYNDWP
jgi:hypothetical protein